MMMSLMHWIPSILNGGINHGFGHRAVHVASQSLSHADPTII